MRFFCIQPFANEGNELKPAEEGEEGEEGNELKPAEEGIQPFANEGNELKPAEEMPESREACARAGNDSREG